MTDLSTSDSERRARVLDTALAVFARYGFRKTSMDDVARTADISRQGLYFLFGGKEELFREAVTKMMADGLASVDAALARDASIVERLTEALRAWYGHTAGAAAETADELLDRSVDLLGDLMQRYSDLVLGRLEAAIAASSLAQTLARQGLTPMDAAWTLHYAASGLKQARLGRADFAARAAAAVKLLVGS